MDHDFHPRTFTLSLLSIMVFVALSATTYVDMNVCPYNRQGGSETLPGFEKPPVSIFSPSFNLFPCHLLDVLVWTYIAFLVIFMGYKWWIYKRQGFHYFLLDFCYFHNACFTFFLITVLCSVGWEHGGEATFGRAPGGDGIVFYRVKFDVAPIGVAVATLPQSTRKIYAFIFFALFGGSCGALLWAIKMWKNALLLHSSDKMTSVYLHLGAPMVQTLMLHGAMKSISKRETSTLRDNIHNSVTFKHLLVSHVAFFLLWQVIYHVVNETRAKQRLRKAQKMTMISGGTTRSHVMTQRVTAYTWLMAKPPGGKQGLLYRAVTIFGERELPTKVMFSLIQLVLHIVFLAIGFVPLRLAVHHFDVWPLLLYNGCFLVLTVWNAAQAMSSWIRKLSAGRPICGSDSEHKKTDGDSSSY